MAQYPPRPAGPIELLENKGLVEVPFINKYWGAAVLGTLTFVGVCVANWYTHRPPFVGLQKHIGYSSTAAVIGHLIEEQRAGYLAERDAVFRHYIQLHPDEFPCFERQKYSEIFERWVPIR